MPKLAGKGQKFTSGKSKFVKKLGIIAEPIILNIFSTFISLLFVVHLFVSLYTFHTS